MIAVSDDPDDPAARLPVPTVQRGTGHHLFFGDPASVPPDMAPHGAVVTTTSVAASDLTILVDRQGATLHPMGRVVRPHLQSTEVAGALAELTAAPGGVTTILAAPTSAGFRRRQQVTGRPHCRRARSTCAS